MSKHGHFFLFAMGHVFLTTCLMLVCMTPLFADDVDPDQVREMIDGAVRYLKNVQQEDGSWQEWDTPQNCANSSLGTLALLSAGLTKDDPAVAKAVEHLRNYSAEQINRTYTVALQTIVFAMADPKKDVERIRKNVAWLEAAQVAMADDARFVGGWSYYANSPEPPDNPNTQYAILALYEAERVGVLAKQEVWERARTYWETAQLPNGAWFYQYNRDEQPTVGMTNAGISCLIMTNGAIGVRAAEVQGDQIVCCIPDRPLFDERIEKALAWLDKHYTPSPNGWVYHSLYETERVGRLSALRFFGTHDWYREGVQFLMLRKGATANHWKGEPGFETYDHVATTFALIFLSKGRRPVLISKLHYGEGNGWSPHPTDLHHLTEYTEKKWQFEMSWQIIDVKQATVDDLLQTPVLFLSGDQSILAGTAQEQQSLVEKIRGYLEGGGFVFAEANPEDVSFDAGFRELMRRVFESETDGYELKTILPQHPIWFAETLIPPEALQSLMGERPMLGIDYGCRTSVVYLPPYRNVQNHARAGAKTPVPPSLSCLWELARFRERGVQYPESTQRQITHALDFGLNVLAYATGRELRYKYEIPEHAAQSLASHAAARGKIQIAMLNQQGNANTAPRAIPKLLQRIAAETAIPVDVRTVQITLDQNEIFDYPILFMHGRHAIEFSDSQRKQLNLYIERGGFLFVNAICSSQPFIDSLKRELEKTFPGQPLVDIAPDDPLLTDQCGGFSIPKLTLRVADRAPGRRTKITTAEIAPKLEGLQIDGRWCVVVSPYDVSCALEEMNGSAQYQGYTKDSAFQLALNVILYAIEYL